MTIQELLGLKYKIPLGFKVVFEWKEGRILRSDSFPENDLIPLEEIAWAYAKEIAKMGKGKIINIRVVDDKFMPVKGYEKKEIENR